MYTTHKKSIKNRILAGVGALFLAIYAMADVMPAAAQSVQQEAGYNSVPVYAPDEGVAADADITEESDGVLDADIPTDEEIPYEELSDEAKQALAEENIPLAGYEEYPAEAVLSAMTMQVSEPALLSGSGESNWDSWVELHADKDADKLINHFDAAYSSDMLEDGESAHYIERDKDFTIKYTVTLNTSKELETGNAVIRIPSALFKDRYGNPVTIRDKDGIALPKYSVNPTESGEGYATTIYTGGTITKSTRTQFGYYIENPGTENETYVIINYDKIKPGSTWFEIVYDKISAFDVVDEQNNAGTENNPLTWSIVPELTANYMFEKERYVFVGNTPEESSDESTLKPIFFNWEEYLPDEYNEGQIRVRADKNGDILYLSEDPAYIRFDADWNFYIPVFKKGETEPKCWLGNGNFVTFNDEDPTTPIILEGDDIPKEAVDRATYCQGDYYRVMTTRAVNGQAVQVYTYYDSTGTPQYQEQVTDGVSKYFKPNDDRTGWVEDPSVSNYLPAILGDYEKFTRNSEALTGYVDTEAYLTDVKKTAGKVTDKVTGNLNSESQLLGQIPSPQYSILDGHTLNQRYNVGNIDMDKNIYVLWEVEIAGKDCTQPFNLYLDEHISYNSKQENFEYTYYDTATGTIKNVTELYNDYSKDGTRIVCVVNGEEVSTIENFNDNGTAADNYSGYTDTKNETSGKYYLIGSSDPVKDVEITKTDESKETKSPAELSGLDGVRSSGSFTKKIKIIVEYPRGQFPENGNTELQEQGVCVDTLQDAGTAGELAYFPNNIVVAGKSRSYDLYDMMQPLIFEDTKDEMKAAEKAVYQKKFGIVLTDEQLEAQVTDAMVEAEMAKRFPGTDAAAKQKGALVKRKILKAVLKKIIEEELKTYSAGQTSAILDDYISELCENLPKTDDFRGTFSSMKPEDIKEYIVGSWKEPGDDAKKQQIQVACEKYIDEELETHMTGFSGLNDLKTFNEKKIYRDVNNDVNVIMQPLDNSDPNQALSDDASHTREDKDPDIPNGFTHVKTASGSKKGWVDMYDYSEDDEFGSTFSFKVTSGVTSFSETHPKEYAYFYDNKSYVHAITADDIVTAEPFGTALDESLLYGRSYVLTEDDYCYTAAKIIVNEKVYNIVDDTSDYGATELSDEALINQPGSPVDRNWYVYVSYGRDASGNTVWEPEPYATISMEDYMNEASADYTNDSKGANVLNLDFSQDAQKPFRIKVEHNTIDYQSSVTMLLTAAIKTNSTVLKPDGSIRTNVFKEGNDTSFTSRDPQIDQFKIRLRNYMAFHTEVFELTEVEDAETHETTISAGSIKVIKDNTEDQYTLLNTALVDDNSLIKDEHKLTDEKGISAEAIDRPAAELMRSSAYVDVSTLEKESRAEKTSTYENDLTHGRAHITYRIAGFEGYQLDKSYKDELTKLQSYSMIPGKERNTVYIYDLLPPGVEFEGFSGENKKPIAGFLKKKSSITDPNNWVDTDKITVSAKVISESDNEEWKAWGGAANGNGRYLVKFTLTLPDNAEDYAIVDEGNWFFGCGIQFTANVSWERYTAAKNTPNLAVYVTDSETIGKHGKANKNEGTFKDDGTDVPAASEKGYQDIYKPFKYNESGTSSIEAYKQNFDQNAGTEIATYNRMYASSMDLGDIARASSTAVGKQVRADADTYALFSERTAVIKGESYTYNVNVENQAGGAVSSIILYDLLDGAGDDTNWQGIFQSIDTSMLTLNEIYPLVYCYTGYDAVDKIQKPIVAAKEEVTLCDSTAWTNAGWKLYTDSNLVKSDVKAVALVLYAEDPTTHANPQPYILNGRNTLSYKILMKSPSNVDLKQTKYAKNQPNYCYYKVERDATDSKWVVDDADSKYYDDPGNITVVTLGERRMLKVAKHVESNFSNSDDIGGGENLEFTFRITRRMMYQDGDKFVEGDVPCANIQYRIYACTFDTATKTIASLGAERDAGIIHTTNENGEFILHDGECAVFQYVPSTTVLKFGETSSELQNQYDFDNYRITEMSKPFWYEFKSIDQNESDAWYSFSDESGLNNKVPDDPSPTNPYNDGSTVHYKQTGVTLTNTYRPVIYISKDTAGVPADMPTNTNSLAADGVLTREEAFNTFDYNLWIYEYPINRLTGEYFYNDDGYDASTDSGTGTDTAGNKAAWLKFKEYYNQLDTVISTVEEKITALETEIPGLDTETQKDAIQKKNAEKEAWTNLKTALEADKAVIKAHVDSAGEEVVFAAPKEDADGKWVGDGYLMRTTSGALVMPISGYSLSPRDKTYKTFNNAISDKDSRENGAVLYTYDVETTADIYDSPEDWRHWETEGADNKTRIGADSNPINVKVRAGNVVALPIYIEGGMMYSDYAFTFEEGNITYNENRMPSYSARYCYKFQEAMDEKYWDDVAGEYKTVPDKSGTTEPDMDERSWLVQTPAENAPYRNTLGVINENIMDYTNNYRFKDIYLQKSVEPADHVPKGDAENSVDTTAFVYRVTRMASGETSFDLPPEKQLNRMSWELWTRDENGKLLEKQMTGAVNSDGMILAPVANYTGKKPLYTIKIRNAEVGYTYRLEEIMELDDLFGTADTDTAKKAELEAKFPYVTYNAADNTFEYKHNTTDTSYSGENIRVFYPTGSSLDKEEAYTLATEELYAVDTSDTSGALKIYDNDQITPSLSKVDMTIDNVYKLRNLTVTKSIIAKTIDNNMSFTMRVRRKDGAEFAPTDVKFYRLANGTKTYLTDAQVNELQGVTSGKYTPTVQTVSHIDTESGDTVIDCFLEFNLKNGIYAELVDVGKEYDEYQIQEKDWENYDSDDTYIHLDPADAVGEWSAWKSAILGDATTATILNGDEGYMILSKTYVSDGLGDYDDYAKSVLESDDNKINLTFSLREKNSGSSFNSPESIPEELVFIDEVSVTNLKDIEIKGGQSVVINLKGLCQELGIPYESVEYKVEETIPDNIQYFSHKYTDTTTGNEKQELYSVMQLTEDDEMEGDKDKTSVEIQNQLTKYSNVIYKRIGGNSNWDPPATIDGDLVLELRDGGENNRQEGVKWIATGQTFSLDSAKQTYNHGITGSDGKLTVHSFEGWSNKDDGNLTYYVKVYFNKTVECNLTRSDNAQVLEVRENMAESSDDWGYLIGYEEYGNADSYVSESVLQDQAQWKRKKDTIVNAVETNAKKVEVYKQVYNRNGSLTEEDTTTPFTFTVKQWVNGTYVAAPGIKYILGGTEYVTDSTGSFTLTHGQTAQLELPQFCYWEITETGKGDYRLLVDDNGEVVYDQGTQYVLDSGLDGLAPDETAADTATYNAQRAASGFTLHTDFDIRAGIPLGDPVVLRRGTWDATSQAYNFVLYDESQDDTSASTYYSTSSNAALYYKNDGTYSNSTCAIDKSKVRDGVIYADDDLSVPIWYDTTNTSISQDIKTAVENYWKGEVDIPEYIFYYEPSGKIYKHTVVGIGSWAFNNNTAVTSVTIPKTVQKIGKKAFYNCTKLMTLNLPSSGASSLLSIGESAFQDCDFHKIHLPEGLIELGRYSFWVKTNTTNLPDIYLPTTLTNCSVETFWHNNKNVGGILEINSGLNNADNILNTKQVFKSYFALKWNNDGTIAENNPDVTAKGGLNLIPNVLILNNIKEINRGFFTDRSEVLRPIKIFVFPDGSDFVAKDGMCVRTCFNTSIDHLFIWRSSEVGSSVDDEHGAILPASGNWGGGDSYDKGYAYMANTKTITLVFPNISKTETAKIDMIKQRFELAGSVDDGFYYDAYNVSYGANNKKYLGGTDRKVRVLFLEDVREKTADEILTDAKVKAFDTTGRVAEILNACGCKTNAPSYPHPPVHTNNTSYIYLAEALWLNDKRKTV